MDILWKLADGVTNVNRRIFRASAWLIYPLIFVIMYEVAMRYVVGRPTNWVYDMTWILFGAFSFLGGAFTLAEKGHVKADIVLTLLPKKVAAVITTLSYLIFFFPLMCFMVYACSRYFMNSYGMGEISPYTSWGPLLWPSKLILLISMTMLLLQGVVEFLKTLRVLFKADGGGK
ncbi:MAG: TRAP transporter small permease subunit [Deltaproteobacteria bacterium]|jgi:TRAP-type mannitol/chloroaromatic compound transport system permease small subunit|nr:TRAP transporter small permease subunit [Deltaproteobacteria bacterium]